MVDLYDKALESVAIHNCHFIAAFFMKILSTETMSDLSTVCKLKPMLENSHFTVFQMFLM